MRQCDAALKKEDRWQRIDVRKKAAATQASHLSSAIYHLIQAIFFSIQQRWIRWLRKSSGTVC